MRAIALVGCWIGLTAATGCALPPRQYTLHVDVSDHSNTQLCWRDVDDDKQPAAGKTGESGSPSARSQAPKCQPFAAQPLSTPGTLTVKLENALPQAKYDLRVEQFTREASKADAQRIVSTVAAHAGELAAELAKLSPGTDGKIVARAAADVKDEAPAIASAVIAATSTTKAGSPPPLPRPPPDKLFGVRYFDATAKKFLPAAKTRDDATKANNLSADTNAPAAPNPPPRYVKLDDADLAYLGGLGVKPEQVAGFVLDWCSFESFVGPGKKPLYDALQSTQPDVEGVRRALGISGQDVASILLGKTPVSVVGERVRDLMAQDSHWDTAAPAAKAYALMALGKTLMSDLASCQANVSFLEQRVGANERARLESVGASATILKLARNAARFAGAFDEVFGPILHQGLIETEQVVALSNATAASTLTLEPGRLELGVGEVDAQGKRTEVASYRVGVRGIERLAIVIGPALTYCSWGCFDSIDQVAQQPTMAGGQVVPMIEKNEKHYNFSLATALHVTLWSNEDLGVGAVLGYPIGAAANTSSNILAGAGLRLASGFELTVGFHAFAAKELKSSYEHQVPIDLTIAGNQGLTVDAVTEDRPQLGVFVMFGFAPNIFSSNKD